METNPNIYDRTQQQNQVSQHKPADENGQQFIQPRDLKTTQRITGPKPGKQAKMSKARAMELVNALKRTLAVASTISFGMFGGLVAMHQVSTTTTQSTSSSSNTSSKSTSSSQNSNNFFNQQGGNTSGTSSSTSSSTTTSSSSSAPVTGTTTS